MDKFDEVIEMLDKELTLPIEELLKLPATDGTEAVIPPPPSEPSEPSEPSDSTIPALPTPGFDLSSEQSEFIDSVVNGDPDQHVLLIGKAGTGKSTCSRALLQKLDELNLSYIRCAPTGVAAINIGGETVHRTINLIRRNRKMNLFCILMDEVSMCRADLMDELDTVCRSAMLSDEPFGGIKLVLVGDPGQLPPVVKDQADKDYLAANYHSPFFFSSFAFGRAAALGKIQVIELTQIFRQTDDRFPRMLNMIRSGGENAKKPVEFMNKFRTVTTPKGVVLTATNKAASEINDTELRKLSSPVHLFRAQISGDLAPSDYPVDQNINLKIGAQAMIVKNIYRFRGKFEDGKPVFELELINGDVGTITEIDENNLRISFLCNRTNETHLVSVNDGHWEKTKATYDAKAKKVVREMVGSFTQLPLRLAWAITIHKSQGATIEELTVDLRTKLFEAGQCYVAFSRGVTLEKLWILGRLRPVDIIVSPIVSDFLQHKTNSRFIGMKPGSCFDIEMQPEEEKRAAETEAVEKYFG